MAHFYYHQHLFYFTIHIRYEENVQGACIADDRFILETFGNWTFGSNDTGTSF